MTDSDDEVLPHARIFSNRANAILQTKFEAYQEIASRGAEDKILEVEEEKTGIFLELLSKHEIALTKNSRGKKSRRGRKQPLTDDEAEITGNAKAGSAFVSNVKLPQSAKKRLKNLELKTSREKKRADEKNRRILSTCKTAPLVVNEVDFTDDISSDIKLKVRYMSDIRRICVSMNEHFSAIFPKVADLFKLEASELLLCIRDQSIGLKDTPQSLNLKYFDTIDCIPYNPSIEDKTPLKNDDRFVLKMQSNDSKKTIDMFTHQLEKFHSIMKRYSELREIPLEELTFEFDGEKIEGSETPEDLDMESGSCIDVRILKTSERSKSPDLEIVGISIKPIPESEMIQICVLD